MNQFKIFAPIFPYLAVGMGLFFFNNAWAALFGFHIAILLTVLVLRPSLSARTLFKSRSPKWILASVLFCSTSGIGLYFLWPVFGVIGDLSAQLLAMGLTPASWPWFLAYFSLVNPFVEEYFWRGVLGNDSLKPYFGDVVFAGYHAMILWGRVHLVFILFAVSVLVSAGWLWRQISREDGGLLSASLGHMAADFTILVTIYWMAVP